MTDIDTDDSSKKTVGVKRRNPESVGEQWVWFTSMGLAVGILSVAVLLGYIMFHGVSVFWPKPVKVVTLGDGAPVIGGGATEFAAIITQKRKKRLKALDKQGNPLPATMEYQFFLGAKDTYGDQTFFFVDAEQVTSIEQAEGILVAERTTWGRAIFYPVAIKKPDGSEILAEGNPDFRKQLDALLKENEKRRNQIRKLLSGDAREVAHRLQKLEYDIRALKRRNPTITDDDPEMATLLEARSTFRERATELGKEPRRIEAEIAAHALTYRLHTGQERTQPLSEILDVYAPNEMGPLGKVGHFFGQFWSYLTGDPRNANMEGGIFPIIVGTSVMTILMSIAVMPFGVITAIYLREYAVQGTLVRGVRIAINNMAGVPSIVYGVFGLGFFVYFVGGTMDSVFFGDKLPTPTFGTGGVLWCSLTLALLTVPVVTVASEEALASVPQGLREASLACGASKWQTIQRVVLPAAAPGILTGLILAVARGAGEVAPLMLVGVVKKADELPFDSVFPFFHLERKTMHLGFHIYDLAFQSPDSEAARPMVFATTFLLITLVLLLNLGAIMIRDHLRRKYSTGSF